jgi:hypothetical protein
MGILFYKVLVSFGWTLRAINNNTPFWGYKDDYSTNIGLTLIKEGTNENYFVGDIVPVVDAVEMEWGRIYDFDLYSGFRYM